MKNYFSSLLCLTTHRAIDFKRGQTSGLGLEHSADPSLEAEISQFVGPEWRSQGLLTTWPFMAENLGLRSVGTALASLSPISLGDPLTKTPTGRCC